MHGLSLCLPSFRVIPVSLVCLVPVLICVFLFCFVSLLFLFLFLFVCFCVFCFVFFVFPVCLFFFFSYNVGVLSLSQSRRKFFTLIHTVSNGRGCFIPSVYMGASCLRSYFDRISP